jgi:hypothetical protein
MFTVFMKSPLFKAATTAALASSAVAKAILFNFQLLAARLVYSAFIDGLSPVAPEKSATALSKFPEWWYARPRFTYPSKPLSVLFWGVILVGCATTASFVKTKNT